MQSKYYQFVRKNQNKSINIKWCQYGIYYLVGLFWLLCADTIMAQPDNISIHNGSVTSSYAHFYDSGGEYGNYQNDEYIIMTIYPEDTTEKVCVTFHEFETQSGTSADILYIYDGNSTSEPLIAELSGVNYGTISSSSSDGSLTFQFISNAGTNGPGWNASITVNNTPEDITMLGDATWFVSSGRFYDSGGPNADYSDNSNHTVTLFPSNSSDKLSVTFHEFQTQSGAGGDVLYVYDGSNTSAPLIAQLSGVNYGTVSASASDGALTFQFVSNASANDFGWYATISVNRAPKDIAMLASGTYITSNGRFYDNGGPEHDYGHHQNVVTTIQPESASDKLSVTFHSFSTQAGSDILNVYDGNSVGAPLIDSFSGDLPAFTVTSSAADGSLTFEFISDGAGSDNGWYASIRNSESIPAYNMTASATYIIQSDSSAFFYDSGGPNANYSANENSVVTFAPANSSDKISVSFDYFQTWNNADYLEVHDGNSVTAPLLTILHSNAGYGTISASPANTSGNLTLRFVSNSGSSNHGGWAAVVTTNATPRNISMPGTYRLPTGATGYFYDAGGPGGNYIGSMDAVTTISPADNNDKLSVSFTHFRTWNNADYLEVHDGNGVTAPLLATLNSAAGYGTISASPANTSGSLTFRFVSNSGSSNHGGWAAVVTTNATPRNISMPGTYRLPTGATGYFYDAGGPGGNYIGSMDAVTTITPADNNDKLSVSFTHFRTWNENDYLVVHDGNSITAPLLGTFSGVSSPGTITASPANTSGSLTFRFVSNSGSSTREGWAAVITSVAGPTGVAEDDHNADIPKVFGMNQNYPNPFNPATTINYQLPQSVQVELTIYSLLGQKVTTLVSAFQTAGEKSVVWDGTNAAGQLVGSGIYFCRLQAGDDITSRKMLLAR